MKTEIKIAPYAPLLIYQKGYTPEFVLNTIRKNNLKGLRIFALLKEDRLESLDFLKDFSFLESLHINSLDDFDFSFLKNLVNLKDLLIGIEGKNPIDLSGNINLESLAIEWRKEIVGIEKCRNLQVFSLYGYKKSDLSQFYMLKTLKELIVKTSSLESLKGINELVHLKSIKIGNCRKLTSVSDLNGLNELENLEFNICPKVTDFSPLNDLSALQKLYLIDCKEISSVKFVENLTSLNTFGLLGNTVIADGNTLPMKNISHLSYRHYPTYNHRIPTPEAGALEKRNLAKIKPKQA